MLRPLQGRDLRGWLSMSHPSLQALIAVTDTHLVSEFVPGWPLTEAIRRFGGLYVGSIMHVTVQVLEALAVSARPRRIPRRAGTGRRGGGRVAGVRG